MRRSVFPLAELSENCRELVALGQNACWCSPAAWGLTQVEMCFKCQDKRKDAVPPIHNLRIKDEDIEGVRQKLKQILSQDARLSKLFRAKWKPPWCFICCSPMRDGRKRRAARCVLHVNLCDVCLGTLNAAGRAEIKRQCIELIDKPSSVEVIYGTEHKTI